MHFNPIAPFARPLGGQRLVDLCCGSRLSERKLSPASRPRSRCLRAAGRRELWQGGLLSRTPRPHVIMKLVVLPSLLEGHVNVLTLTVPERGLSLDVDLWVAGF